MLCAFLILAGASAYQASLREDLGFKVDLKERNDSMKRTAVE